MKKIQKVSFARFNELLGGIYYRHYEQPVSDECKVILSVKVGKKRFMVSGRMKQDVSDVIHSRSRLADYLYFWSFIPNSEDKVKKVKESYKLSTIS